MRCILVRKRLAQTKVRPSFPFQRRTSLSTLRRRCGIVCGKRATDVREESAREESARVIMRVKQTQIGEDIPQDIPPRTPLSRSL